MDYFLLHSQPIILKNLYNCDNSSDCCNITKKDCPGSTITQIINKTRINKSITLKSFKLISIKTNPILPNYSTYQISLKKILHANQFTSKKKKKSLQTIALRKLLMTRIKSQELIIQVMENNKRIRQKYIGISQTY